MDIGRLIRQIESRDARASLSSNLIGRGFDVPEDCAEECLAYCMESGSEQYGIVPVLEHLGRHEEAFQLCIENRRWRSAREIASSQGWHEAVDRGFAAEIAQKLHYIDTDNFATYKADRYRELARLHKEWGWHGRALAFLEKALSIYAENKYYALNSPDSSLGLALEFEKDAPETCRNFYEQWIGSESFCKLDFSRGGCGGLRFHLNKAQELLGERFVELVDSALSQIEGSGNFYSASGLACLLGRYQEGVDCLDRGGYLRDAAVLAESHSLNFHPFLRRLQAQYESEAEGLEGEERRIKLCAAAVIAGQISDYAGAYATYSSIGMTERAAEAASNGGMEDEAAECYRRLMIGCESRLYFDAAAGFAELLGMHDKAEDYRRIDELHRGVVSKEDLETQT